jgi:hypothetical protein
LSQVNWKCRLVSHSLPVGRENTMQAIELIVENDVITGTTKRSIEQGPAGWRIDDSRHLLPNRLEALHRLASSRETTEFKSDLYSAFQLHSRNSVATEVSHKIVFVVAAIESLLLKDSNEPIQKNLGERMAFLIGNSLQTRKEIIKNVDEFYRIRSEFIHHGKEVRVKGIAVVDKFFSNVWDVFDTLLTNADRFKTREELLAVLEDRKLT